MFEKKEKENVLKMSGKKDFSFYNTFNNVLSKYCMECQCFVMGQKSKLSHTTVNVSDPNRVTKRVVECQCTL
jgi:hypothetical protein